MTRRLDFAAENCDPDKESQCYYIMRLVIRFPRTAGKRVSAISSRRNDIYQGTHTRRSIGRYALNSLADCLSNALRNGIITTPK